MKTKLTALYISDSAQLAVALDSILLISIPEAFKMGFGVAKEIFSLKGYLLITVLYFSFSAVADLVF